MTLFLAVAIIVLVVVAVDAGPYFATWLQNNSSKVRVVSVVNGVVTLQPGAYQPFQMNIPPTATSSHVLGNFNASGGYYAQVSVMDDANFFYLQRGQSYTSLYNSGLVANAYINVLLGTSRIYYLIYASPYANGPTINIQTKTDLYYYA